MMINKQARLLNARKRERDNNRHRQISTLIRSASGLENNNEGEMR
ncbi:hypothetical protein [Spirulina subsalsa]|nr:hypothetical protein [Spirulina subsalsa]